VRKEDYPKAWEPHGPGVTAVEGYRWYYHGKIPSDPEAYDKWRERRVLWHWAVPEELQNSYPAWAADSGRQANAALCLYDPQWKRNPEVLLRLQEGSGLEGDRTGTRDSRFRTT